MHKKRNALIIGLLVVVIIGGIILFVPPVWEKVSYHAQTIYAEVKYKLFPPENVIFVPGQSAPDVIGTAVQSTLAVLKTPTPQPTATAAGPTPMPTSTPIPLPPSAFLSGVRQEMEEWNNCGPATLSMYLSYWKWSGNQDKIAPIVKPNSRDKNVMPYELQDYLVNNTDFLSVIRVGGDLQTLKELVNAGIPVMIEKGFSTEAQGWMGHYELVIGYNDEKNVFLTQDSYLQISNPDAKYFEITYGDFYQNWRAFNFVFLVVFPQNKQNDVMNLLGPLWDEATAIQVAHDRAASETTTLTDPRDRFFAWFNLGSSLVDQLDYANAASAYDKAYLIMPTIPEKLRPWRMMWYQTGPYYAYYYSQRYSDVINLANTTLTPMAEPVLEESYYWRGLAENMLGDQTTAIADLRKSAEVHPGFPPAVSALQQMGVTP